jgi:putative sigma-54 modulation protein
MNHRDAFFVGGESNMKIQLVRKSVDFDNGMREFIEERVDSNLRRFSGRITWVRIQLEDTNGPKGGMDKRCIVSAGGDDFETRVVEVRDVGLRAAVSRALQIVSRSVVRALERARELTGRRSRISLRNRLPA